MIKLTQKYVRGCCSYNPETGEFLVHKSVTADGRTRHRNPPKAPRANEKGYQVISLNGVHKVHRLIWLYMTGDWPDGEIDHINRVRDDNRFENLRVVTPQEQQKNKGSYKKHKAAPKGISYGKRDSVWLVKDGKKHVGQFSSLNEAIIAQEEYQQNAFNTNLFVGG